MEKIKVYFILPTLFAGGAERVISFVSQNLNQDKFDVKLIVIGFEKDSKFDITKIPVTYLNKSRVLNAVFPIIKLLVKEKPNIVLSSISHLNSLMGLISILFRKMRFVGRHATINKVAKNHKMSQKKSLTNILYSFNDFGYKKLDYIVCQSSDMKEDFLDSYDFDEEKIRIIHNPITEMGLIKTQKENETGIRKFITVGRLSKIKGQLRIIELLSKVDFPFKYTIVGDGSYKDKVFDKIKTLNLQESIDYIEYTDQVPQYLVKHDMFLQGSYSEGFPNALLESCAVGVPVLAFNVPGGTKEIVTDNENGFLAADEKEFLEKLHNHRSWDPKYVSNFVYEKFNKQKILNDYEQLFTEIAHR